MASGLILEEGRGGKRLHVNKKLDRSLNTQGVNFCTLTSLDFLSLVVTVTHTLTSTSVNGAETGIIDRKPEFK